MICLDQSVTTINEQLKNLTGKLIEADIPIAHVQVGTTNKSKYIIIADGSVSAYKNKIIES